MNDVNTCLHGDSVAWMAGVTDPFADLVIADPPFNINFPYDSYNDRLPEDVYLDWSRQWIKLASALMVGDGNLLICMGDEHVSDLDVICRKELGLHRLNWMIWHYKFGQSGKLDSRRKFTRSKTHILRFGKIENPYFNAAAVAVPSDRQRLYSDKRADPRGKCPDDVFIHKRVCGTHHERFPGIATQMPVALLRPWVKAMCKPGGFVFDPFPGSGSSLDAAKREGCQFLGVELSRTYTDRILDRLSRI